MGLLPVRVIHVSAAPQGARRRNDLRFMGEEQVTYQYTSLEIG
ncbi:hypothetical protein PC116_g476 [Phytophthora cactorum]|nr:hypothetical protein PC120_g9115 [Phytophthora cactorum]KAG4055825.1 hypothetical protein PC123_g9107 [Phytophthora cactorum]KAG4251848.1 hypothetical protein PC116_g476 [Phytophthora cactorum]